MTCNEFRQWFQDHESDEMTDVMRAHLDLCEKCRQIFALDQSLETKLSGTFEQLEVPRRLQERLDQNMTANSRWRMQPRIIRRAWAPALAVAAMLVLFLLPFWSQNSSFASMDELGRLAIVDHLSHDSKGCSSSALLDLEAWSLKEVGYRVNKPALPEGAELVAASKCRLGECDTVHLMYSRAGKTFSVFVFPKDEADFSLAFGKSYSLDFGDHQVTLQQRDGQIQAMVI